MGKRTYTYDGSNWVGLTSTTADLSNYANLTTTPVSGFRNKIINGDFKITQRGASISNIASDGTYTADRWYVQRGGNLNYNQRQIGSYNPPNGFEYYGEYVNNTASNPFIAVSQAIETRDSLPLAGRTVTISFYARANANTTASKTLLSRVDYSTSVDTKSGTTSDSKTFTLNFGTASTDWQRFSWSTIIPATAKTIDIKFIQNLTLAVNDGFHLTGVQVELGTIATPFEQRPFSTELALCQRYYERYDYTDSQYQIVASNGMATSAVAVVVSFYYKVEKRAIPTAETSAASSFRVNGSPSDATATSISVSQLIKNNCGINFGTSGRTVSYAYYINRESLTSPCFIAFNAEL